MVENGSWSCFADGVLTYGKSYVITLIVKGEHEACVKVTEVQPESISLVSVPTKTTYYLGINESLDLSGLDVQANFSNGITDNITVTSDMVSGFDSSVAGTQTLTVTYSGLTTTFDIEVVAITADNVADCLAGLDYYNAPYTIAVTGAITQDTLSTIKSNVNCEIKLDLSQTTGLTRINSNTFSGSYFSEIILPSSVVKIIDNAFSFCYGLTSVTIGSGVTSIGNSAFEHCTSLTSVVIPDSVETIGPYAFYKCESLASVTIGSGVTSVIDSTIFDSCKNLTSMTVSDNNTIYMSYENCIYTANRATLVISVPGLTDVTVRNGTTTIGEKAFYNCSGLTSVTLADSVETIESQAFGNCTGLTSIAIPDSVTSIGGSAFYNCTSLASMTIGSGVVSIGDYAFDGCKALNSVTVSEDNTAYTKIGNCIYTADGTTLILAEKNITEVTIPASVTTISAYAFDGCGNLITVNYASSEDDWNNITINSGNDDLGYADITYNYTGE